ncbi:GGDEF domain-containing protein, partial [Patescibacteria group bacterium]|nr:GGDEF domain-containing protein [Patescibacteria group bacterium]
MENNSEKRFLPSFNRKEIEKVINFAATFPEKNNLKKNEEYLKREEFWMSFLKLLRKDVDEGMINKDRYDEIVASLLASKDWLSGRDTLTGLPNRTFYDEAIKKEITNIKTEYNKNQPLSLLVIDVNNLKKFNDQYGHHIGDLAIILTARRIEESIRKNDLAARWGGDEFIVILPKSDLPGAKNASERISKAISKEKLLIPSNSMNLSVSIGIAEYNKDKGGETAENFFKRADDAVRKAKTSEEKIVVADLEN